MSNTKSGSGEKKRYVPRNQTEKSFNRLKNLFGVAGILLGFWTALITAFLIGPILVMLIYSEGYNPATFTVEQLIYIQGQYIHGKHHPDKYWADGTVNGQKEMFKLGGYIKGVINNQEELEQQIRIGQKLAVLYNPEVPPKFQKRVVYPEEDFHATWKIRQSELIQKTYLPLSIVLGLCIVCGVVARNLKSTIGFVIGSLFFVLFALIPSLINIYF